MEITMLETDNPQNTLIEFSGSLSSEEAQELARGAYKRIAAALHVEESQARERARSMLTDLEFNVLVEETVKARAADRAIRELGISFVLEPSARSIAPCKIGQPYRFEASVHPVPAMGLDLKTPIELPAELQGILAHAKQSCAQESPSPTAGNAAPAYDAPESKMPAPAKKQSEPAESNAARRTSAQTQPNPIAPAAPSETLGPMPKELQTSIKRALRARLAGTVSATLESAAFARENKAFLTALEEDGETYREYRIRTGKKPQEVEAELRRGAMRQLYDEVVLEIVFREQRLTVTPEDEAAILHEMAPDREDALREELDNAGKLWMLTQKARRVKALSWAIGNLTK